jgi:tetratricopeptide (TPR) repeat protein
VGASGGDEDEEESHKRRFRLEIPRFRLAAGGRFAAPRSAGSAGRPASRLGAGYSAGVFAGGYHAEAVRVDTRLTQMEPNNALFQNKLGIAYHQMQDLNSARRAYRRAVEINPQYAQAINNLASVEYAQKKYRNAIMTYLRALKLNPGDAVIYGNLGTAYFAREEFEYATQSFRYALMLDPEVFRRSGRVGTIVQARDDGNPAIFNFYMAKTYASTGNVDETLQFLIKAWEEGYPDLRKTILEEEEFQFLAVDPRFEQFLALMASSGDSSATTPIQQ